MKGLLKKDIDWLWKAASSKVSRCFFSVKNDCAISTDGWRMHIINDDKLSDEEFSVLGTLKQFDTENAKTQFSINPKYLLDALSGFQGQVNISLFENEGKVTGVRIEDSDTEGDNRKLALAMCMTSGEEKDDQKKRKT